MLVRLGLNIIHVPTSQLLIRTRVQEPSVIIADTSLTATSELLQRIHQESEGRCLVIGYGGAEPNGDITFVDPSDPSSICEKISGYLTKRFKWQLRSLSSSSAPPLSPQTSAPSSTPQLRTSRLPFRSSGLGEDRESGESFSIPRSLRPTNSYFNPSIGWNPSPSPTQSYSVVPSYSQRTPISVEEASRRGTIPPTQSSLSDALSARISEAESRITSPTSDFDDKSFPGGLQPPQAEQPWQIPARIIGSMLKPISDWEAPHSELASVEPSRPSRDSVSETPLSEDSVFRDEVTSAHWESPKAPTDSSHSAPNSSIPQTEFSPVIRNQGTDEVIRNLPTSIPPPLHQENEERTPPPAIPSFAAIAPPPPSSPTIAESFPSKEANEQPRSFQTVAPPRLNSFTTESIKQNRVSPLVPRFEAVNNLASSHKNIARPGDAPTVPPPRRQNDDALELDLPDIAALTTSAMPRDANVPKFEPPTSGRTEPSDVFQAPAPPANRPAPAIPPPPAAYPPQGKTITDASLTEQLRTIRNVLPGIALAIKARLTGALCLEFTDGIRRILFKDGEFLTIVSGMPGENLLQYLVLRGEVRQETANQLIPHLPHSGRLIGAALVARGILTQEQLWPVLRSYGLWLLCQSLFADLAQIKFETDLPTRLSDEPQVFASTPAVSLLIEAVQRSLSPASAKQKLGKPSHQLHIIEEHLSRNIGLDELFIERVNACNRLTLSEAARRLLEDDYAALLALRELNLIEFVATLQQAVQQEHQFEEEVDHTASLAQLRLRCELSKQGDYFKVLGVSPDAPHFEIRQCYEELKHRFAPSSMMYALASAEDLDIELINQILDEAYFILGNETKRSRYSKALGLNLRRSSN